MKWKNKFEIKPGSWVYVPSDESVADGIKLKNEIENKWTAPPYYYHLQQGGHVQALRDHLNSKSFSHLDIKNFFQSVNRTRITRNLKKFFPYGVARDWANKSTVVDPNNPIKSFILPFGFVQSPILASLCLYNSYLGSCLEELRKEKDIVVTVYVDDIILSAPSHEKSSELIAMVKASAEKSKFKLNDQKEEGPAESITAFNIATSNNLLELTPEKLSEFIQTYRDSKDEHQKAGIEGYIGTVNPSQIAYLSS